MALPTSVLDLFIVTVFLTTLFNNSIVFSQYVIEPSNVVVKAGGTVDIHCKVQLEPATDSLVGWFLDTFGFVTNRDSPPVVHADYSDNFNVFRQEISNNNDFNLRISDIAASNAGSYACKILFPEQHARWLHVIVINSVVNCSDSTEDHIVVENTEVEFYCDMEYQGHYAPTLNWLAADGSELPSDAGVVTYRNSIGQILFAPLPTNEIIKVRSTLTRIVTAEDNNIFFQCTMSFGDVPNQSSDDQFARNIPELMSNTQDTTAHIQVLYTPRGVRKTPINSVHNPGDTLYCDGESNPEITKVHWINIVINETIEDRSFVVTADMEGAQSYQCIIFNEINGQEHSNSEIFNFTVEIPTTVAPTTVPPYVPGSTRSTTGPDPPGERVDPIPNTTTPPAKAEAPDDGLSTGAIIGIVVGIVIVVIIILIILFCCCRNKKEESKPKKFAPTDVRQPDIHQVTMPPQNNLNNSFDDVKPESLYGYENPQAQTPSSNPDVVYADLALDNTPRSRNPIQVYEPTIYDTVQHNQAPPYDSLQNQHAPPSPYDTVQSAHHQPPPSPYDMSPYAH